MITYKIKLIIPMPTRQLIISNIIYLIEIFQMEFDIPFESYTPRLLFGIVPRLNNTIMRIHGETKKVLEIIRKQRQNFYSYPQPWVKKYE